MARRRILLDTRPLVQADAQVTHRFWPARKHGAPVLTGDRPWERWGVSLFGSVLHEGGRYRMWYNPWPDVPPDEQSIYVAYAESTDGIGWEKPDLGIRPFGDAKGTNLTDLYRSIPSIVHDPSDPDPARRYKAGGWVGPHCIPKERADAYPGNGFYVAHSADGLRWYDYQPVRNVGLIGDTCCFIRDEPRDRYFATIKKAVHYDMLNRRSITVTTSRDFVEWTPTRVALVPDALDDRVARERGAHHCQFYGMGLDAHDDLLIGFVWMFWPHLPLNQRTGTWGVMDCQLVYSYDGDYWLRTPDRRPFIEIGDRGDFDAGQIVTAMRPVAVGDELRLYYSGSAGEHGGYVTYDNKPRPDVDWSSRSPWNDDAISFASIRRDRYASLSCTGRGAFVVRHGRRDGDRLLVNARIGRGGVRAQLLDAGRAPIEGFGLEECVAATGDTLGAEVSWRGRSLVDLAPDQELFIRFALEDADLFAYELA